MESPERGRHCMTRVAQETSQDDINEITQVSTDTVSVSISFMFSCKTSIR